MNPDLDVVTRLREDCDEDCKYATSNAFVPCDKCEAADEIERLRKIIRDIADAVTNEGVNPKHHRSVVAMVKREWPFLWRRIEIAVKEKNE